MNSVALRLRRRRRLFALRGDAVRCPCCGGTFARFMPATGRPVGICPRCGAEERHRAVRLWLEERRPLDAGRPLALLHWAPEPILERYLRARPGIDYVSADLAPGRAMRQLDLTAVDAPDATFDVVFCIHVLEHIEQEGRALSELRRILAPGGWALVLVPIDFSRARTYEDPSIVTPQARTEAFWRPDHVRLYGTDFPERLAAPGLEVEVDRFVRSLPQETIARHGLFPFEDLFIARRPAR